MSDTARRARWSTGRTEAFSDGVIAIAITLLVLELGVPEDQREDLWSGIASQWPSYLGYATSFLTIGGIWLSHQAMFSRLRFVNRRLVQLNLLLLMAVSFLPFPTRLVAESIADSDTERAAVVFYGLVLLAISTVLAAMWRIVAGDPDLLDEEVDAQEVSRIALAAAPSMAFYAVVIGVALIAPQLAAFGYLGIAVVAVLTARGEDAGAQVQNRRGRRRRSPRQDHEAPPAGRVQERPAEPDAPTRESE
jgi:uncharacterized membrane protein